MRLELSLTPVQELAVDVAQETAPNQRKEFAEAQASSAGKLLDALPQSPGNAYLHAVQRVTDVLSARKGAENAQVLGTVLRTPDVMRSALADPIGVSAFGENDALRLSVAYMHATADRQGGFQLKQGNVGVTVKVVRALLEQAVLDETGMRGSLQERLELARSSGLTEGLQIVIREQMDALQVASTLRPRFETVAKCISVAHRVEDGDGRPFRDFFDRLAVQRSMTGVATDAIQRQFASRMTDGLGKKETAESATLALLNPVARQAFLAMGFLEPKILRLFKHCYDGEVLARERAKFAGRKIDLLLDKRELRKRHDLFWFNDMGWKVPSRGGARLVEEIVTSLVREDGEAALEALNGQALFSSASALALSPEFTQAEKPEDRDLVRLQVRGMLAQSMTSEGFTQYLASRLPEWTQIVRARLEEAADDPSYAPFEIKEEESEEA